MATTQLDASKAVGHDAPHHPAPTRANFLTGNLWCGCDHHSEAWGHGGGAAARGPGVVSSVGRSQASVRPSRPSIARVTLTGLRLAARLHRLQRASLI